MSKLRGLVVILLGCCLSVVSTASLSASGDSYATTPTTRGAGKWRIAYYQGGPHDNYYRYLSATIKGWARLGWIDSGSVPPRGDRDTRKLWRWLVDDAQSDYLEFVEDAYYSADWDERVRGRTQKKIIKRLNRRSDIDLVIAMGTWAGQDLANDRHSTPTVVMSSSDPIRSHIVKSADDSGLDHVHARVDPQRYERQLEVFHNIIGFDRLGIAYENSEVGRSYAAIDTVEKIARARNFEVVTCHTRSDIADQEEAGRSVVKCFEDLVKRSDAIYVTVQGGVNSDTLPELVRLAVRHRIPTFSQLGSSEVQNGLLLSISRSGGFEPVGMFMAETTARIFNGAKPGRLNQVFEESPNIAINLKTAEMVGLYLYADILAAADEIYRNIEIPR